MFFRMKRITHNDTYATITDRLELKVDVRFLGRNTPNTDVIYANIWSLYANFDQLIRGVICYKPSVVYHSEARTIVNIEDFKLKIDGY